MLSAREITLLTLSSSEVVDDGCIATIFSDELFPERLRARPLFVFRIDSALDKVKEFDVGERADLFTTFRRKPPGVLSFIAGGMGVLSSLDCGPGNGTPCIGNQIKIFLPSKSAKIIINC